MSHLAIITATAVVVSLGCSSENGNGRASGAAPSMSAAAQSSAVQDYAKPAVEATAKRTRLVGKAVVETTDEAASPTDLSLSLDAGGGVTGTLVIDGTDRLVDGLLTDETVRCWVRSATEAKPVRAPRGVLVGSLVDKEGQAYQGTFVVSDSGAASVVRGTWTASAQH